MQPRVWHVVVAKANEKIKSLQDEIDSITEQQQSLYDQSQMTISELKSEISQHKREKKTIEKQIKNDLEVTNEKYAKLKQKEKKFKSIIVDLKNIFDF